MNVKPSQVKVFKQLRTNVHAFQTVMKRIFTLSLPPTTNELNIFKVLSLFPPVKPSSFFSLANLTLFHPSFFLISLVLSLLHEGGEMFVFQTDLLHYESLLFFIVIAFKLFLKHGIAEVISSSFPCTLKACCKGH